MTRELIQIGGLSREHLAHGEPKNRDVRELQEDFKLRLDRDGVREVLVIGNERDGGCPFHCIGCGVHEQADMIPPESNASIITKQLAQLQEHLENNRELVHQHGYHIAVYNYGNVTNRQELSPENFQTLLQGVQELQPKPTHLSLNSRGSFISTELLESLQAQNLGYNIHFIIGVESLTEKGAKIYGKPRIASEVGRMFTTIDGFNKEKDAHFGIDANFVFLPEFYADSRDDTENVRRGFVEDVKEFIASYAGKHTPLRINIHPFYPVEGLYFAPTASYLGTILEGMREIQQYIDEQGLSEALMPKLFLGVNDSGYQTEEWRAALERYGDEIERVNRGA